jgi:hypothetical protein
MAAGKGGGIVHALEIDRGGDRLGEPDQLGQRIALGHAVPGEDRRALGRRQQLGRRLDRRLVAPEAGAMRVGRPRSISSSAFRISAGMERKTGPVGGASAVLAARWTRRGRSARRRTSAAHLTKGRAISGSSAQRIGSVSAKLWSCWPAVTMSGAPAFWAS